MKDLGQEALDEMNRLLLNQQRLKTKLERMGDNQIADLNKKVERLQEQLNEANEIIKYYDSFSAELTSDGKYACKYANSAHLYLEKWGVK